MARLKIYIILILSPSFAFTQDTGKLDEVDSSTYRLYTEKNWTELIQKGEEAIDQGIDFYYLRCRVGIAYFTKEKYALAAKHFEKSLSFYSKDPVIQEYYYYSLIYSGQKSHANRKLEKFDSGLIKRIAPLKNYFFTEQGLHYQYPLQNISLDQADTVYNEYKSLINYTSHNFSLGHQLGNSWSLFYSLQLTNYNFEQNIQWGQNDFRSFENSVNQSDFYAKIQHHFSTNVDVSLFGRINQVKNNYVKSFLDEEYIPYYYPADTSINDYFSGFSISKRMPRMSLGFNMMAGKINMTRTQQYGAHAMFYPFGNLNFYFGGNVYYLISGGGNGTFMVKPKLGLKINPRLWVELFANIGEMKNFTEEEGYILYNEPFGLKHKSGISLLFPLNQNIQLSIHGIYSIRENNILKYTDYDHYEFEAFNYSMLSITGGLRWNF